MIRLLFLLILLSHGLSAQTQESKYFVFHNDYWMNMHHFLYEKASDAQKKHLTEDGNKLVDIGLDAIISIFAPDEKAVYNAALGYYRDSLIGKDLVKELIGMRLSLKAQKNNMLKVDSNLNKSYAFYMNAFSPVFEKKLWPLIRSHNHLSIDRQLPKVKLLEDTIVSKMEQYAQEKWPTEEKVRVDLTAYANWAGAYTPYGPDFNIIISSLDPAVETSTFIEIVFHEGSHLLFGYGTSFRSALVLKSREMDMEVSRGLWHAAMFYMSGMEVKKQLKTIGKDHELNMIQRNIYQEFNNEEFRTALDQYMAFEIDLNSCAEKLILSVKG